MDVSYSHPTLDIIEPFAKILNIVFGWGAAMHPCAGKRWGKLQQNMLVAHALASYKWTSCDANGNVDPHAAQRQDLGVELDSESKFALPPAYCKFEPRE
jgi:sterol 14-demethylase